MTESQHTCRNACSNWLKEVVVRTWNESRQHSGNGLLPVAYSSCLRFPVRSSERFAIRLAAVVADCQLSHTQRSPSNHSCRSNSKNSRKLGKTYAVPATSGPGPFVETPLPTTNPPMVIGKHCSFDSEYLLLQPAAQRLHRTISDHPLRPKTCRWPRSRY